MIAGSELRIGKYLEGAVVTSCKVVFRKLSGGTAIVIRIRALICAVRPGYEVGAHKVQQISVTTA